MNQVLENRQKLQLMPDIQERSGFVQHNSFSKLIDEMVEIETKGTHDYLIVLEKLGRPAPPIDERLEHILITGMFNTFFELIIHEMPLEEAKHYLKEMRAFYTAGWMKIMGQ